MLRKKIVVFLLEIANQYPKKHIFLNIFFPTAIKRKQIANWFDLTIRISHHYASTSQCMVVVCTGLGPIQEQQLMEVYRKRVSFYFPCFLKYGLKSGTILTIHFRLFSGSGKTICDHYTLVLYQTLPRTSQVLPYSREFLLTHQDLFT